ncbi:hypothetical protein KY321_03890 [Candidatus Woesearchaeota archaeon]|nr:hypothetical protein [Candidatus Woesearchaeota archaeon]
MSSKNNDSADLKIHTGFRLSKNNYELLEDLENDLGITKTSVVNMILSLIKKDKSVLINLIKSAIIK